MADEKETCEGGCACGHVRYEMTSLPLIVHCCHCTWCQRQNGSAFAVNALIEADRVHLAKGEVVDIEVPSPSGANQRISRYFHFIKAALGDVAARRLGSR
jgi:hypothetical protein